MAPVRLRLGLITKVIGPTPPGMSLGARNTNGPFCTAGGAGGGLLAIMNCEKSRADGNDRSGICDQPALMVRPLSHFGLYTIPGDHSQATAGCSRGVGVLR